jgi:hypothetical protein
MTWPAYRQAAIVGDLLGSFDAMVALGMRPLPIGEHHITGKIKIPIGDGWGNRPLADRREQLKAFIEQGVPVGVGCQPDGYIVLDIDPPNKDRSNLLAAWKETASLLFGCEDWPNTTIISTEAGCHVWFKSTQEIAELWKDRGKLEMALPSGGKVEFFTGNNKQIQVACPPSEGKEFKTRIDPIDIPESAANVILDILKPQAAANSVPVVSKPTSPATPFAIQWFNQKLHDLTGSVMNASEGNRHDTYRKSVRTMAGYAAGMNLESMAPLVYTMLASAHREAKPEVSEYVLDATFRWAWNRGIDMPLTDAMVAHLSQVNSEPSAELSEDIQAADCETILGLMKEREWLWGDPVANVGWFVKRGLHLVEGKEGTGKSRWMLDLKRRWGMDMTWPDGSPIHMDVDSKMLFVAADSHFDQIAMTAQEFGIDLKSIIFTGPTTDPYSFTSLDDPQTLALIRHWCTVHKVGMVVIDTLMAASSRPLVDPQEVAKIAGPLRELARELNVAIVLVGHLNANGETWGRAMGRQCDNVIRMEADEHDEQKITIKSVKARWNRFALPIIEGRQSETGWEYTSVGSEIGDTQAMGKRERAEIAIRAMLAKVGRSSWGDIQDELQDQGNKQGSINLALKFMVSTGEIIGIKEEFSSGKSMTFYDFNPEFNQLQG